MGDRGHTWREGKVDMLQVEVDFCEVKKNFNLKEVKLDLQATGTTSCSLGLGWTKGILYLQERN